jgi:hypothetical protein
VGVVVSAGGQAGDLLMLLALGVVWAMAMTVEWSERKERERLEGRLIAAAHVLNLAFRKPGGKPGREPASPVEDPPGDSRP